MHTKSNPNLSCLITPVDAAVTRFARDRSLSRHSPVAYRHEKPNNHRLEKRRGAGFELREEILGSCLPKRFVSGVDQFERGSALFDWYCLA
jgi:hypothetical protein